MSPVLAVLDASPLIIFYQIGRLNLLRDLFDELVAPSAVAREIAPSLGALPPWVKELRPRKIPQSVQALDPGEREAIALAVELSAQVIVLDDLAGRRSAVCIGLGVVGSAGLLVRARRLGLIQSVRPELDAMLMSGLFVGRSLYREILDQVGEANPE